MPDDTLPLRPFEASPLSGLLVARQRDRAGRSFTAELAGALGLRPGSSVLDIGSGAGEYAFLLGGLVGGSGSVTAADCNPDMAGHIRTETARRGLANISPVTVRPDGTDIPARPGGYDLIFMAHTHGYIRDREAYYAILRRRLGKDGVFALLAQRYFHDIRPEDISDPEGLEAALGTLPGYARSRRSRTAQELAGALNAMINDPEFHRQFLDGKGELLPPPGMLPEERWFIDWVLRFVILEDGAVFPDGSPVPGKFGLKHAAQLRKVRHILVSGKFRGFINRGTALYLPGGPVDMELEEDRAMAARAGFRLRARYGFIPFEVLLVFEPEPAAGAGT